VGGLGCTHIEFIHFCFLLDNNKPLQDWFKKLIQSNENPISHPHIHFGKRVAKRLSYTFLILDKGFTFKFEANEDMSLSCVAQGTKQQSSDKFSLAS
jgi:hypothetical protein